MDGQHWIYVFLKAFSYGPCGLFQKETRLLKSHAGLSIVHEEDGNSCSFNPSLMSPLLLWWDEKDHGEIHTFVSGCAGCQEGQEGQLGCASPKLGGSDFPAGQLEGLRRGEVSSGSRNEVHGSSQRSVSHKGNALAVLPLLRTKTTQNGLVMVVVWVGEDRRTPITLPYCVLAAEMSLFSSWKEKG